MNRYLLVLTSSLIVVGCLKTRAELAAEESGQQQERQTIAQQRVAGQQAPYKEKAPPTAYRFEEYDEQMRTLSGRLDASEYAIAQLKAAKQSDQEFGAKGRQAEEQKFLAYEEALKKLEAQVQTLNDEVAKLKEKPAPEVPPPANAASAKGRGTYDLGEEHFTAKKWKDAIVNYQKYRDQNPKGKQYADATYKIGVCFQELGMKEEARSFLEEVTAKFPKSKEAKKAEFRLKSLK
jgi:TolA-binding protein